MASVKFQKGSEEWMMFQDYYKLVQDYYIPEEADEYWEDVIKAVDIFVKKYQANVPLARNIALALAETLENSLKNKRKG